MADLNKLATSLSDEGVWMEVLHPKTGRPIEGMRVRLAGMDSDIYSHTRRQIADHYLRNQTLRINAESVDEESLRLLVASTLAWEGFEKAGQPIRCDPAAVRELYADPQYNWLRKQVNAFIGDQSNFIPA